MPIFEFINNFLNKEIGDSVRDGRTQQFILADAGMGKTSLLVMQYINPPKANNDGSLVSCVVTFSIKTST